MTQNAPRFCPTIMISQSYPASASEEGATLRAIEESLSSGFFQGIQTVEIPFADERKAVGKLVKERNLAYTYCITRVLNNSGANLSGLNEEKRLASVATAIATLSDAWEAGAQTIALVSGPSPGEEQRAKALLQLEKSLTELCRAAAAFPLTIMVEPLDYFAHKKNALGTSQEAAQLHHHLRERGLELAVCLDAAHILLNGETIEEAVKLCGAFAPEFHYCNCITDPDHPLYGDYHLPFGKPGVIGPDEMKEIAVNLRMLNYFGGQRKPVRVCCEVLKQAGMDSQKLVRDVEQALRPLI